MGGLLLWKLKTEQWWGGGRSWRLGDKGVYRERVETRNEVV